MLACVLTRHTRPLADLVINGEVDRWDRWFGYPEGHIHAWRSAARLIAAMPPRHVARQAARLASRLDFDHALVTEAITDQLAMVLPSRRRDVGTHPEERSGH